VPSCCRNDGIKYYGTYETEQEASQVNKVIHARDEPQRNADNEVNE
jgi:hypothetical protein